MLILNGGCICVRSGSADFRKGAGAVTSGLEGTYIIDSSGGISA